MLTFNQVNLFVLEHDTYPLAGIAFDNGFSIDAAISDRFFGISHEAYGQTKSLRLGHQKDFSLNKDTHFGTRLHYTSQHASGNSHFKNIKGHGLDGELFTNITLPLGQVELSLAHDIFLGGQYEFLGAGGKINQATTTALTLGYG